MYFLAPISGVSGLEPEKGAKRHLDWRPEKGKEAGMNVPRLGSLNRSQPNTYCIRVVYIPRNFTVAPESYGMVLPASVKSGKPKPFHLARTIWRCSAENRSQDLSITRTVSLKPSPPRHLGSKISKAYALWLVAWRLPRVACHVARFARRRPLDCHYSLPR
jgi:hypothetical protein